MSAFEEEKNRGILIGTIITSGLWIAAIVTVAYGTLSGGDGVGRTIFQFLAQVTGTAALLAFFTYIGLLAGAAVEYEIKKYKGRKKQSTTH